MVITYHGGECFKVAFGDTTLAFNPISKDSAHLKPARFGADIAFVSTQHPDCNGVASVTQRDSHPFVIDGPGEYEVGGVLAKGAQTQASYDGTTLNTVYRAQLEQMQLLFLGTLSENQLTEEAGELIDAVDVLFVPIGGDGVLDPATAHALAVRIGPKVVVPMHYPTSAGTVGNDDALSQFLKEAGAEKTEAVDKLTLKRRDLEHKSGEVVVLSA